MIRNFIKIAGRILWRNKSFSILNLLCLTFGLTCAIIATLYVMNILSYDKFHKHYDHLFEVEAMVTFFNGDRFSKEPLSASLSEVIVKNVPEIESITRVADCNSEIVDGERSFSEKGIYADENFFDLFTFPSLVAGPAKSLSDINSIVITQRTATKLFKTTDCLGKMLVMSINNKQEVFKITGILKNVPSQSLLQFDFVLPFSKFLTTNAWAYETGSSANKIWVLLNDKSNVNSVNQRIKDLIRNQETTLNQELFLFPLKEKMLYAYSGQKRLWRGMQNVVIAGSIGFAILLIACFNFINLAIALNIRRYKEVGLKKVVGAGKSTILLQFLAETFILIMISLLLAIVLVKLLQNGFNAIFHGDIQLRFTDLKVILAFCTIGIFTGIVSGLLPALYLSSSSPTAILKTKTMTSHSYSFFRQSLIVFQFIIPIVLIICAMVIKVQDGYMRNFDVGVKKEKLIILNNTKNIEEHEESLKAELNSITGIESVSFTNCIPTRGSKVTNEVNWEGKDIMQKQIFWCINTDFNYNKVVDVRMTAGRFFDRSFLSDSTCYVINDIAASVMKNKNPVGSPLTLEGKKGTIIGVFTAFHAVDLAGPFAPVIISLSKRDRGYLLIRFSSESYRTAAEKIGEVYRRFESDVPYQPVLFKDLPDYSNLRATSNLVTVAFIIAIILACLGLLGLASYTVGRRTKEIGIRKANGATILTIMKLLLKNCSRWLTIAFIIAMPFAFILGRLFLSKFYFRAPMPLWPFIAGPAIAYLVALLTVSLQSWRAATKNPGEALCYE